MIYFDMILHPAFHIYDFHIFITSNFVLTFSDVIKHLPFQTHAFHLELDHKTSHYLLKPLRPVKIARWKFLQI